jgi:hypothetical protein
MSHNPRDHANVAVLPLALRGVVSFAAKGGHVSTATVAMSADAAGPGVVGGVLDEAKGADAVGAATVGPASGACGLVREASGFPQATPDIASKTTTAEPTPTDHARIIRTS